jgi:hypothetical protein
MGALITKGVNPKRASHAREHGGCQAFMIINVREDIGDAVPANQISRAHRPIASWDFGSGNSLPTTLMNCGLDELLEGGHWRKRECHFLYLSKN